MRWCWAVVVAVLAGCGSPDTALDLRATDWREVAVPGAACFSSSAVELREGEALIADTVRGNPSKGGGPSHVRLAVMSGDDAKPEVTYGDLNGDRQEDAFLRLHCSNNAGTASGALLYSVAAFTIEDGRLRTLGLITPKVQPEFEMPTLLEIRSIGDGQVVVAEQWYRDGDSTCCPSGSAVTTWTWDGTSFQPLP